METRGDSLVYGEYYRVIGTDPNKKSLTYLIGVSDWQSSTVYKVTQLVRRLDSNSYYQIYICIEDHTSGSTFSSSKWEQLSLHLQEVRDDVQVITPLEHDSVSNTFSIKESGFNNADGGFLSQDNFKRFSYKQDNYTVRFIGSLATDSLSAIDNTNYTGKYECMLAKSLSEILSNFTMVYKTISESDFDLYIKNDENLISDTKDNSGTFNIYIDNNKVNLQNI